MTPLHIRYGISRRVGNAVEHQVNVLMVLGTWGTKGTDKRIKKTIKYLHPDWQIAGWRLEEGR
jgi:hypothetical protein